MPSWISEDAGSNVTEIYLPVGETRHVFVDHSTSCSESQMLVLRMVKRFIGVVEVLDFFADLRSDRFVHEQI